MKRVALVLAIAMVAACGGDNPTLGTDSGSNMGSGSDGGMPEATLTSYVLNIIAMYTTATDLPRPYSEFQTLPDPDGSNNNGSAYSSLF